MKYLVILAMLTTAVFAENCLWTESMKVQSELTKAVTVHHICYENKQYIGKVSSDGSYYYIESITPVFTNLDKVKTCDCNIIKNTQDIEYLKR